MELRTELKYVIILYGNGVPKDLSNLIWLYFVIWKFKFVGCHVIKNYVYSKEFVHVPPRLD